MVNRLGAFWAVQTGTTRGIVLMMLSTLGFSGMHVMIRYLSGALDPIQIAFFRNFFGLIVFLPWFLRSGLTPLRTNQFKLHALRAGLNVCAMLAFFSALGMTPVSRVTALGFTAPLFAAVLSVFVLGEVPCVITKSTQPRTIVLLTPVHEPTSPLVQLAFNSRALSEAQYDRLLDEVSFELADGHADLRRNLL